MCKLPRMNSVMLIHFWNWSSLSIKASINCGLSIDSSKMSESGFGPKFSLKSSKSTKLEWAAYSAGSTPDPPLFDR